MRRRKNLLMDERMLKMKTCKRVWNYFDSYPGQKFLQTSNILSYDETYTKEERDIIQGLIKIGT